MIDQHSCGIHSADPEHPTHPIETRNGTVWPGCHSEIEELSLEFLNAVLEWRAIHLENSWTISFGVPASRTTRAAFDGLPLKKSAVVRDVPSSKMTLQLASAPRMTEATYIMYSTESTQSNVPRAHSH